MSWWEQYLVQIPEGTSGDWKVERYTVDKDDPLMKFFNFNQAMRGMHRKFVHPGTYTRLSCGRDVVMSDSVSEIREHMVFLDKLESPDVKTVLINGLGIGMSLRWALLQPHIEHVDVVEKSADVIALVGPSYYSDSRLTIHHADAFEKQWPRGTRWDVAWHDIWTDSTDGNLPEMTRLHRKYGSRVGWQESWERREWLRYQRRERRNRKTYELRYAE